MGARTLVSREEVRSGRELIRRLPAGGVVVTGAAWVQTESDAEPYLYIVSPTYERDGPRAAIERMLRVANELNEQTPDPLDRLNTFELKLVGPSEPIGRGIAEYLHRFNDEHHAWHGGSTLGPVSIDGAYIYPAALFAQPSSA